MKKLGARLISVILVLATLFSLSSQVFAADETEYLSDIRLVMAESYDKAKKQLESSIYKDYKLHPYNMNDGNSKYFGITDVDMGVYIAYTTSPNVNEAITDIAVMDMNGGYREGNMQAALEASLKQYVKIAEKHITAIDYMLEGVEAEHYLSIAALRQLNIYRDSVADKRVGDMFEEGISAQALANMFLKGNTKVVENLRALIAMGSSYNEDGKTYLEKVEEAAAAYNADPTVYDSENWYEIATTIEATLGTLRDYINEYRLNKDDLDYEAEEWGEKELVYVQSATIGILFEEVPYVNGKNLADFIVGYEFGGENYKMLYPLIAALNPAQKALTELGQFIDVVRYENTLLTEKVMESEIVKLEEEWAEGFDIYYGVDLGLYNSTFAVTTEADRSSATSGRDFASEVFFRNNAIVSYVINGVALTADIAIYVCRLLKTARIDSAVRTANAAVARTTEALNASMAELASKPLGISGKYGAMTGEEALKALAKDYDIVLRPDFAFHHNVLKVSQTMSANYIPLTDDAYAAINALANPAKEKLRPMIEANNSLSKALRETRYRVSYTSINLVFSGVLLCISAYQVGTWVYNYYNPKLSDIPADMVDVVPTDSGDRFIHYHAAESITPNKEGEYKPVCLNAFEGSRWIALYYTKSYEAGNALLPEFKFDEKSSVAPKDFKSVAKFGDENAYNLNNHAFRAKKTVYMSVAVSDDSKEYLTDVPDVVGTIVGAGGYVMAAIAGAGVSLGSVIIVGKVKKDREADKAKEKNS